MKNSKHIKILAIIALGAFPFMAGAAGVTAAADANGSVMIAVPTSVQVQVGGDATSSSSADTNTGVMTAQTNTGITAQDNTGANVQLETNTAGVVVTSAAQVSSDNDLSVFSKNIVAEDTNVAKVDVSASDSVAVDYKHHGKFLALFPITISSRTMIVPAADGSVKVHTSLPWWHIFVTGTGGVTAADAAIQNSDTVKANATASATASAKASVAETAVASLDSAFGANANTNVSAAPNQPAY